MSRTRTYRILISNNAAATAGATVGALAAGEIAFLKDDGTFLAGGDTITDSAKITPVMGMAAGDIPKYAPTIQGANVVKYEGTSYVAAAEQLSFIGCNGTINDLPLPAVGDVFSFHIVIQIDPGLWSERQLRRSFEVTATAATVVNLAGLMVAAVNADVEAAKYVTASVASNGALRGLQLDGVSQAYNSLDTYQQVAFKLSIDLGFTNATAIDQFGYLYINGIAGTTVGSNSTAPSPGSGTYPLVATMEEFAIGYDGALNRTGFPIPAAPRNALSTGTYDVYSIANDDVHASSSLNGEIASPVQTIIAVPAGSANQAAIEAILNPYMASVPKAFVALAL